MPDSSQARRPRPAAVTVTAYLLLMNAGGAVIYFLLFGRHTASGALQLLEASGYADFFIAIGLLRAQRWARMAYVIAGMIGIGVMIAIESPAQGSLALRLLFAVPAFATFLYLLYREDARLYFASAKLPRPSPGGRRRIGAYLYIIAAVYAYWCLNAIVLGITEIYPASLHRDKLIFIALPVILIAEWVGNTPGRLARASILSIAFALYLAQMFFYKYISPYAVQIGPSLWQLRNWAIGMSCIAIALHYLQWSRGARK
ncbi:hypothetical protein [Janthinobacterium agaricidamnosum]|nr:hypothetical protein [Janthinobacterium agaricidamnosum]